MINANARAMISDLVKIMNDAAAIGTEHHSPPPILYHFTNLEGVRGILSSKMLRGSRATALNDASEITFGVNIATQYLGDRLNNEMANTPTSDFLENTRTSLESNEMDHFVVSFCGDIQRSGHWLHYGHSGTGNALGFDSSRLETGTFKLMRALYDPKDSRDVVESAIRTIEGRFFELMSNNNGLVDVDKMGRIASDMCATAIRALSCRLKHPSFRDENEWRLMRLRLPGVKYDTDLDYFARGTRLVPYWKVQYPADGLPLKEIVMGYSVDRGRSEDALNCIFKREGINPTPTIVQSDIPVRPNL